MNSIRQARRRLGLSQVELAEAANVSPATVVEIERGHRQPQGRTLRKLAGALGVEVADLLEADSPKATAPPLEQSYEDLLAERGFPSEQIAAYLGENEREEEFIRRELEKMSAKDFKEALMKSPGLRRMREHYRESEATRAPDTFVDRLLRAPSMPIEELSDDDLQDIRRLLTGGKPQARFVEEDPEWLAELTAHLIDETLRLRAEKARSKTA